MPCKAGGEGNFARTTGSRRVAAFQESVSGSLQAGLQTFVQVSVQVGGSWVERLVE
jgi:hypothetical protein